LPILGQNILPATLLLYFSSGTLPCELQVEAPNPPACVADLMQMLGSPTPQGSPKLAPDIADLSGLMHDMHAG
jgi:hypothetical protein